MSGFSSRQATVRSASMFKRRGLGDVLVILQMPRGNLETVSLRVLVLRRIFKGLRDDDFVTAWKMATEHRVDVNVIVDFEWPKFLTTACSFVQAIASAEEIGDLMLALKPDSVFDVGSPYALCLPEDMKDQSWGPSQNKVTDVCDALRSAMININEDKYCKAIALSHARSDPPDFEKALLHIKACRLKELEHQDVEDGDTAKNVSSEAMAYLMLYVDVSDLYRASLGMYDLSLAYMVIRHAQRDPGEYLMELETFASLKPEAYQRASIDRSLHRYSSCLKHLLAAGPDHLEDAIDLASEHSLFHELLAQMQTESEERTQVLLHYGTWLKERGYHEDAGAAFLAAKEYALSMEAYQSCTLPLSHRDVMNAGVWQMVFNLAGIQVYSTEAVHALAIEIVEDLKTAERYADAAEVCWEYLQDKTEAVRLLLQARKWRDAVHLCYRSGHGHERASIIGPSAASAAEQYLKDFQQGMEHLQSYSQRLIDVRNKKQAMEATVGQTGLAEDEDIASTVAGLSLYTDRTQTPSVSSAAALTVGGRSPKNKKKKKLKIKRGAAEEEAALVLRLKELRPHSSILTEVSELTELLIYLGFFDDARQLQTALDGLIKAHEASLEQLKIEAEPIPSVKWKWDIFRGF